MTALSGNQQLVFPRGYIAMGNGDLMQVTNVKVDHKNNAKQVHTLRRRGAGVCFGNDETTVSFDAVIDENGSERPFFSYLRNRTLKQLRVKVPGETITVNGAVSDLSRDLPLDGEIKYSITFVGHSDDP